MYCYQIPAKSREDIDKEVYAISIYISRIDGARDGQTSTFSVIHFVP